MRKGKKKTRRFLVFLSLGMMFMLLFGATTYAASAEYPGSLTIKCSAQKNGAASNESFDFTLIIDDQNSTYGCVKHSNGKVELCLVRNGVLNFTLKNGEYLTWDKAPAGINYEIISAGKIGYGPEDRYKSRIQSGSSLTVTGTFDWTVYAVETSIDHGTITPTDANVPYGESREISFSPANNYEVQSVLVDGVEQVDLSGNTVVLNNVTANHTVQVICKAINTPHENEGATSKPDSTTGKTESAAKADQATKSKKTSKTPADDVVKVGENAVLQNISENGTLMEYKEDMADNQADVDENEDSDKTSESLLDHAYIPGFGAGGLAALALGQGIVGDIRRIRRFKG